MVIGDGAYALRRVEVISTECGGCMAKVLAEVQIAAQGFDQQPCYAEIV